MLTIAQAISQFKPVSSICDIFTDGSVAMNIELDTKFGKAVMFIEPSKKNKHNAFISLCIDETRLKGTKQATNIHVKFEAPNLEIATDWLKEPSKLVLYLESLNLSQKCRHDIADELIDFLELGDFLSNWSESLEGSLFLDIYGIHRQVAKAFKKLAAKVDFGDSNCDQCIEKWNLLQCEIVPDDDGLEAILESVAIEALDTEKTLMNKVLEAVRVKADHVIAAINDRLTA